MDVFIADEAGFCFGVKRALRIIDELYAKGEEIQILGELIHNSTVLENLKNKGIDTINELSELDTNKTLIIRTHGIPVDLENSLKEKGVRIVDTTCPLVKKTHQIIAGLDKSESKIILIGDNKHPEIKATASYSEEVEIINSPEQAGRIEKCDSVSVVAQTTLNREFFREITCSLFDRAERIEVFNTICSATRVRQEAIAKLAPSVEGVVVIGGKNSSNTRKLYEIASSMNKNTMYLERSDLLEKNGIKESFRNIKSVGITGGASTPPDEIDKVKEYFESFNIDKEN